MNTFRKIRMALVGMLCLGLAFACTDKENSNDNNQSGDNTASQMVGNWLMDGITYNGETMDIPMEMTIVMNANGTGEALENGQSHNNNFTWSVSGNTLTINTDRNTFNYTITSISNTECTLHGNVVPVVETPGDVIIHLTKVNGGQPGPDPDPEAFPAGTTWEWTMDTTATQTEEGVTFEMTMSVAIRLAFAPTGHNATVYEDFVSNVSVGGTVIPEYGWDEHESSPCTWTYDEATHTGNLHTEDVDPETGTPEVLDIPFTYVPGEDVIIVEIPEDEPDPNDDPEDEDEEGINIPNRIVMHRVQ